MQGCRVTVRQPSNKRQQLLEGCLCTYRNTQWENNNKNKTIQFPTVTNLNWDLHSNQTWENHATSTKSYLDNNHYMLPKNPSNLKNTEELWYKVRIYLILNSDLDLELKSVKYVICIFTNYAKDLCKVTLILLVVQNNTCLTCMTELWPWY